MVVCCCFYTVAAVSIVTSDGRHIIGTLRGYDQATNVILDECFERVYREDAGVETIVLGLYMIRGDTMYVSLMCAWCGFGVQCACNLFSSALCVCRAVIGELDEEKDAEIDYSQVKAPPLKAVNH